MESMLLLSTCGTSVLTNRAPDDLRTWLAENANAPALDDARLAERVSACRGRLAAADDAERRRISAELNGIGATIARWKPKRVQHLLVHSDTAVGRAAVGLVSESLAAQGQHVQMLSAAGLRTDDVAGFRAALAELTHRTEEWVTAAKDGGQQVVFNLTGGFKSLNAYLQSFGMLYADQCVFLFEGSDALIEIPRLPVKLAEADEVRTKLLVFRRLHLNYPVSEEETTGIPASLLFLDGGRALTSVWGDVVWTRVRRGLLAEALLEPLSPKLVVQPAVGRTFAGLGTDERFQVNEALDALSAHLDGVQPLLASRKFKPLAGDPVPGSTHELYAWSHGATGRLFGHYDAAGRFVVDALGKHL